MAGDVSVAIAGQDRLPRHGTRRQLAVLRRPIGEASSDVWAGHGSNMADDRG